MSDITPADALRELGDDQAVRLELGVSNRRASMSDLVTHRFCP